MESLQTLVASLEVAPYKSRQIAIEILSNPGVEWGRIKDINNIGLCIEEAIYNVKNHTEGQNATIDLLVGDDGIVVRITDQGPGFDYKLAIKSIETGLPYSTKNQDSKTTCGRGLPTILDKADKVEFNDAGNSISMHFDYTVTG
ncbi:MAG: ATP-binding protein [Nanoarchaeota archaeon]